MGTPKSRVFNVILGISSGPVTPHSMTGGFEFLIGLSERSFFSYQGQGSGLGFSYDVSAYLGVVYNLGDHASYEGEFWVVAVDLSEVFGTQVVFFGAPGTIPVFNDNNGVWGFAAGPTAGAGASISFSEVNYKELP